MATVMMMTMGLRRRALATRPTGASTRSDDRKRESEDPRYKALGAFIYAEHKLSSSASDPATAAALDTHEAIEDAWRTLMRRREETRLADLDRKYSRLRAAMLHLEAIDPTRFTAALAPALASEEDRYFSRLIKAPTMTPGATAWQLVPSTLWNKEANGADATARSAPLPPFAVANLS